MSSRVNPKMFAVVLCAAMLSAAIPAQGKGQGKGQGNGQGQGKSQAKHGRDGDQGKHEGDWGEQRAGKWKGSSAGRRSVVFTTRDQGYVRDYYRNGSNLPPGLAKRGGDLPPGLRRQLQRNGTLPPGLQQRLEPLSADLERRLSPLPIGASQNVRCESDRSGRRYCWVDTYGGVRMSRQFSDAACTQGSTWGYTTRGVWVSNGCRADFETLPTTYYRGRIGQDVVVVDNRTQRIVDVIRDVLR